MKAILVSHLMSTFAAEKDAKIWLTPDVDLDESLGFNASELRRILQIVRENRPELLRAWHDYFGDDNSF